MSIFTDLVKSEVAQKQAGVVERFVDENNLRLEILDAMAQHLPIAAIYRTLKKSYGATFGDTQFKEYCASLREELA